MSNESQSGPPAPGEPAPAGKAHPPAPIRITRGPNGLVISSADPQALDQLEELIEQVQPPRDDFKIFHLRFAYASSVNRGEYCMSKAGMGMMTLLFADRLAEYGINVYEVRPGIIETDMTGRVKEKYDQLIGDGLTPIRRWGIPDDVAKAVLALAEGVLPFSTGEIINVDGGFHMRRL